MQCVRGFTAHHDMETIRVAVADAIHREVPQGIQLLQHRPCCHVREASACEEDALQLLVEPRGSDRGDWGDMKAPKLVGRWGVYLQEHLEDSCDGGGVD